MNSWRIHLVFFCIAGMTVSLFLSRFMLSLFTILFVLSSFLNGTIKTRFRIFFSSPLLWGMSVLFLLPLISGLWSDDKEKWLEIVTRKLPLFFLPLAFSIPSRFSKKQKDLLGYIFIISVTAGTLWSMFHYAMDMKAINESYLRAKSIVTPLENDHVRFSWLVSLTILLAGWMCWQIKKENSFILWGLGIIMLWLCVYIHVLAARTGLFSFYIIVFGLVSVMMIRKRKFLSGAFLLLIMGTLPFIAYWLLPSFQNRVKYILYDYGYFKDTHYLPGGNDAVRTISLKAGWNILRENPVKGVGAGDVLEETKKWYRQHYPAMQKTDMIYPSSEWLIYGDAAGWGGLLIFSVVMCIPFFVRHNYNVLWLLLNTTAAASMLFDIGLEVQFGIFIYSFVVLWWWSWLLPKTK